MRRIVLLALVVCACASNQDVRKQLDAIAAQQAELARQQDALAAQQEAMAREQLILSAQQRELAAAFERDGGEAERRAQAREPEVVIEVPKTKPGRPDPAAIYRVDLGKAHVRGGANAKVTIVEFGDFQCPFCARVQTTLSELRKIYGDEVRIAFKHNALPMHNRAMAAAIAAEAAGKLGKFWPMHDRLFANQRNLDDDGLRKMAREVGLNVKKFERTLADAELRAKIDADQLQGNVLGAPGTPAFFINGRFLSGAQPVEAFRAIIDEEMKRADEALKRGVPRAGLYEHLIANGRTEP